MRIAIPGPFDSLRSLGEGFAKDPLFAVAVAFLAAPVLAQPSRTTHTRPVPPAMVTDAATGIDVLDYDLDLTLAPPTRMLEGKATITLRRTAATSAVHLDLVGLAVTSVAVRGQPQPVRADSTGATVALGAGGRDTIEVAVAWRGSPADGLIIRTDTRAGWTAFGDNWPNRARQWFPSVDHPSDKATVSFTVRVPTSYVVVANGTLRDRTEVDGPTATATTNVWRFRETHPIPTYLMVIGVAAFSHVPLGETACGFGEAGGCVSQGILVEPASKGSMPGPFAAAGGMVRFYASLFGRFPYAQLLHVQSATRFGGMENAGAIFYAWDMFQAPRSVSEGTIAHETAHQWFGDAVTERAWAHVWLSEGFADYLMAMWMEHAHGDSARKAVLADFRRVIMGSAASRDRPVIDTTQGDLLGLLNTNSYQKGAHVLHMLRREVGDSAFVRGLRAYQLKFRHGTALTDDLRAAVEAEHGAPLGWFFDQWLRKPGWAELDIAWQVRDGRLVLDVGQSARFGAYRLTLPVRVTMEDGTVVDQLVALPASAVRTTVTGPALPGGASVRGVQVDPDGDLLAAIALRRGGPA
ncbi:MAG: M1 family metallopeptidase [Gemmatimonadetes bacterium]|nr:M1 family metallopeptidase [Gemmatimonadota bacterium]